MTPDDVIAAARSLRWTDEDGICSMHSYDAEDIAILIESLAAENERLKRELAEAREGT